MPRVLFTEAARIDFTDAIKWYDAEAPEIADRFQNAIDEIVQRIEDNSHQFAPSSYNTRRAIVRRFPYLLIFREQSDVCYVVAMFHMNRNPTIWQKRVL